MSELLPCPWCGEQKEHKPFIDERCSGIMTISYCVACANCGVELPETSEKESAIKEWNTRADKTHYLQMAVEAVEKCLSPYVYDQERGAVFNAAKIAFIEAIKQRFLEKVNETT